MLRFFNICLSLALVVLAYVIYQVKYDTRSLDVDIASLSKDIEAERDSVAVLRAEWSRAIWTGPQPRLHSHRRRSSPPLLRRRLNLRPSRCKPHLSRKNQRSQSRLRSRPRSKPPRNSRKSEECPRPQSQTLCPIAPISLKGGNVSA